MAIKIGGTVYENAGFDVHDEDLRVEATAIDSNGLHRRVIYTGAENIPEEILRDLAEMDETEEEEEEPEHVDG